MISYKEDTKYEVVALLEEILHRNYGEDFMKENKIEYLIWIIFASIGAILVIIGLVAFGSIFNYENKVDTVGTITEISYYSNAKHNRNYEVYVSYIVDGKEYESRLNSYSSSFYEGKEIDIYYDKDDPSKIGVKSLDLLFLIFPGIGLIFLAIGGTGILVKINRRKLEKNLKENGKLIYANYVETVLNTSYQVNGKCPYNIICEWDNTLDGKKYIFKSKNIWINPKSIIEEKDIKQFPIYIDNNNKKKYAIDIDILTENIVDLR